MPSQVQAFSFVYSKMFAPDWNENAFKACMEKHFHSVQQALIKAGY